MKVAKRLTRSSAKLTRALRALLLLAVLTSACASSAPWIPPSAPPGALLAVTDLLPYILPQAAAAPQPEPTTQPAQELQPAAPVETPVPLPADPVFVEAPPEIHLIRLADAFPAAGARFALSVLRPGSRFAAGGRRAFWGRSR